MALIGSGSYRDIPNVYTAGKFDPAQIDTGFGAVVDQVGGTSWGAGAPITRPGNLDESNFSLTPGFSNGNKLQSYAPYFVNIYLRDPTIVYGGKTLRYHIVHVVPLPMLFDRMSVAWGSPVGDITYDFKVDVIVNGNKLNPAMRWMPSLSTTEGMTGEYPSPITRNGVTYYVSRSAVEGPVQLSTGDVIGIYLPSSVTAKQMTITLACRVLHQP